MKKNVTMLTGSLLPVMLFAQNKITGRIINKPATEPLSFAGAPDALMVSYYSVCPDDHMVYASLSMKTDKI